MRAGKAEELGQALAKLDKQAAEAAAGGRTAGDIFAAMGVQVTGTGGALKSTTELLAEARSNMQRSPYLARELLADVATALERIQRLMIEAKVGVE